MYKYTICKKSNALKYKYVLVPCQAPEFEYHMPKIHGLYAENFLKIIVYNSNMYIKTNITLKSSYHTPKFLVKYSKFRSLVFYAIGCSINEI